jgi:hypothetical protein
MRISSLRPALALIALAFYGCGAGHNYSAAKPAQPPIILQAREVIHGIGGIQSDGLMIKLTNDGKAEWEKYIGRGRNKKQTRTGTISADEVGAIKQRLDVLDKSVLKPQMGPYAASVDTWNEVSVQLVSEGKIVNVSISNPWAADSPFQRKDGPMPKEVRAIICEIDKLRVELAFEQPRIVCNSPQN